MSMTPRAWISALPLVAGFALPTPAAAQKALVYCPVSIDAAGCGAIVMALAADTMLFPGGIDGAYDGTQGTVDLATVDLGTYAVLVVPSLADGAGATPYALLRDPTIAARLKAAFMGRAAAWSGTPDVGSTNRTAKDNLIRNLARWVRPDSAGSHGPGVVVLQDNSDDVAARYTWLSGISSASAAADSTFTVYSNVQVLTQAGSAILTNGGTQIGYTNMASFALLPDIGTNSDATGGRTAAVVLATVAGEPSDPNIATVQTDREDYFPPDTVVITGAGWDAGETVTLGLQEDMNPPVHPEVTLTATADAAGHILNQEFEIDSTAIGVRFTLTATGQTSGRTAQATFTDNTGLNSVTMLGTQTPTPVTPGGSATYGTIASNSVQVRFNGNGSCTVTLSVSGLPAGATAGFAPTSLTGTSTGNQFSLLTINTTGGTSTGTSTLTVRATGTGGAGNDCSTSTTQTATTTLVIKRASNTTVTGPASSTFGASVTFTATVGGGPSPTGTVQFKDGAANLGALQTLSGGTASVTTSALTSGAHTITAVYSGDANFGGSTSPNFGHTVNPASTTTVLSSSVNPSTFGQSISLSATVTGPSGSGTPTGSIQFRIDGSDFGSSVALSGGSATSGSTNSLAVGSHPVAAVYTPDAASTATFSGSTSTVIATQTVNQALSTTTLVSSVNPSVFGESVTLTATVKNGAIPIAIGSISFIEGGTCATPGTTLQVGQTPNASGVVTFTTTTFSVTGHTVLACYDGSGSFGPSQATLTQTVNKAATTTTITSDTPDPSNAGQAVAVHFTVTANSPGSGTPGGNVTVSASGGTETCTGTAAAGTCSITLNASGARTLTATYAGDPNFSGSTSATAAHTVNLPATVLTVASASGAFGGTAALSATLTSSGDPVAGKSVSFTLNGSSAGSATTNASGVASIAAASLGAINAATYPTGVAASFAGDVGFGTSSGSNSLTVNQATVTLTATVIPTSVEYGSTVELDADLSPGLTSRAISFDIGGTPVGTATTDAAGKAKLVNVNPASFGLHTGSFVVTASFPNEQNFGAATGTGNLTVTPKTLTPVITADNKVYDGTTSATILTRALTGVVGSDDVTLTGGTASFATKTVGTGKAVTGSGFTLAGADAANYVLASTPATTTSDVTERTLTVTATGESRVYDATAAATVTLHDDRVSGDAFSLSYTAAFADKHVGNGRAVSVTGIAIGSGSDAANYQLGNTSASTTADITPATLVPHITASDKVYDGNANAGMTSRTLTGVLASDIVTLNGGTASFADKNVGATKTVTGSDFTLAGADAGNYVLDPQTASATAAISQRDLVATAQGHDKVYDATAVAAVTLGDDRVAGDLVTLSHAGAVFGNKHVGTGKPVSVSGIAISGGADAGNYHLTNTSASATASITPASLAPHVTADNKVYDGSTAAAILTRSVTVVLGTDDVSLTGGSATFADKNVGTGKSVTATGFVLAGDDAGNYVLVPATAATTASISQRPIAVAVDPRSKVYGDDDPSLTYHVTGDPLVTGDAFTGALTRSAGETVPGGPYAITQGTLTAGGNYALAFTGAKLAITPATLTVTAGNAVKKFGDAVPAPLTGNIVGVKFTDNISATYTAYVATGGLALVTPTTPVAGSPYPIIPEVSGSPSGVLANYTVVPVNGGLTVQKATPAFNGLVIPNVVVGQSSSTVSGNLKYLGTAGTVFPSGAASVTVNGQTQPGTIQANGNFTATFNTAAFPPSGTGLTVSLSYNGSDPNFTVASSAGAMKVLYTVAAGHQFLQPINPNLTTGNRSSFKIGSTIPTKFQLFKADGTTAITSAIATIAVVKIDNTAETPINEDLITSPADDGINFRVSSGQYIYNLSTKNWTAGTYRIIANLDDGSQITAEVDGRSK
jgi:YDG domain-containing protein/Big-like domain-containing protein/MBG domain-containing protein